jgi:hypothetical protein
MPQRKVYGSHADRQAAYRKRCEQARQTQLQERGLPAVPALPEIPGTARWRQAVANAVDLLLMVEQEMQAYYDDRLETWKEGDKGETFQERLEAICQAREGVEEIDIG